MARISTRVLEAIQRIYRYVPADRAPSELDIDVGVSMVHDVRPDATFGTGLGPWQKGWGWITDSQNHVGVGSIGAAFTFTNPQNTFQGFPDPYDRDLVQAWIYGSGCGQNDVTDFALADMIWIPSGDAIAYSVDAVPTAPDTFLAHLTVASNESAVNSLIGMAPMILPIPVVLRPGGGDSTILFRSTSDTLGTVTISMGVLCWFGSRYTVAPGLGI